MLADAKENWLLRLSLGNARRPFRDYLASRLSTTSGAALTAVANFVFASLLLLALKESQQISELRIWWITLFLITATALLYAYMNRNRQLSTILLPITLLEAIKGLAWIAPATYLFPPSLPDLQLFIALLLIGVALSSAIAWHMAPTVAYGGIGLGLPIAAIAQIFHPESVSAQLTLVMLGGWLGAVALALFLRSHQVSRLRLLHEKNTLAQSVEQKILELERLRVLEKQSRKEAEAANEAKSRFLAHSSHDLRQPLHAISLLLETVSDHELDARSQEVMSRVRHSLDGLTELFDALLDLALLDTGQVDVNHSTFPAAPLLHQIISEFSETARARNVELRCASTNIALHTDPIILRRLVQNLVSNAIQHANGRAVLIGVRKRGGTASIEVYDSGKGIPPAQQKKIFQEFTRLANPTTTSTEKNSHGLGLGLAITQRLARILNMQLAVRSELNAGSVFRIVGIPRAEDIDLCGEINSETTPVLRAGEGYVAIIDDDAEILRATSDIIRKWGFETDIYEEYRAGTFKKPDILLCDYELSGGANGVETVKRIRRDCQTSIPAIIITGNTSENVSVAIKEAGLAILYKPVRPAQLRSALLAAAAMDTDK